MHAPHHTQTMSPEMTSTFFGEVMGLFAMAIFSSSIGAYTGFTYALPYLMANPGLMWVIFIAELALIFTSGKWSKMKPLGQILFWFFSFLSGLTLTPLLGIVVAQFGGGLIYKALLATAITFSATALVGWRTNLNLRGMRGFLFVGLLGMIVVGVIGFFIPWSNQFEMIYSGIGVALFGAYTMYDMQRIKYSEGQPMMAAISLYLDIFNMFIFILRLMMSLRRD